MDHKDIIEILRVGLKAVSPYNLQPWVFQFKQDRLVIFPKYQDRGFLGNSQNVVLYSLGALLENLSEGAKHFHYEMTYRLLRREVQLGEPLCEVLFRKTLELRDYDISHVLARYTNRKQYRPEPVPLSLLEEIRSLFQGGTREILDITRNEDFINLCAQLERIRIANLEFNEELIDNICYTPALAEKSRRGLDLRVLELPLLAHVVLRLVHIPFFRKAIARSRLAQKAAEMAKKKALHSCSLLVAFKNEDGSPEASVRDWMAIQKILNLLQQKGLSSQLLGSSPDLTKIKMAFYLPEERKILDQADAAIQKCLGTKMQYVLTLLRVGYADESRYKSLRLNPEDLLLPE